MTTPTRSDFLVGPELTLRYWLVPDDSERGFHEIAARARHGDQWGDIMVFSPDEMHLLPDDAWEVTP